MAKSSASIVTSGDNCIFHQVNDRNKLNKIKTKTSNHICLSVLCQRCQCFLLSYMPHFDMYKTNSAVSSANKPVDVDRCAPALKDQFRILGKTLICIAAKSKMRG